MTTKQKRRRLFSFSITGKRFIILALLFFALFVVVGLISFGPDVLTQRVLFQNGLIACLTAWGLQSILKDWLFTPLYDLSKSVVALSRGTPEKITWVRSFKEINVLGRIIRKTSDRLSAQLMHCSRDRSQTDAILSGMIEGVVVLDQSGRIVLTNPGFEKMFHLQREQLSGQYHYEVLRHHQLNVLVEEAQRTKQPVSAEIAFDLPHPHFILHVTPTAGATSWLVLVFHDITVLKRLEQVRADFVANISHELKTPLAAVKGYLETLVDEWDEDRSRVREYLEVLQRHTDRMQNIVSDLLQLSRIESGRDPVRKTLIPFQEYIDKIILSLAPLAKRKEIILVRKNEADFSFWADPAKMQQVFINLLDNALKYTSPGGRVEIGAIDQKTSVVIHVSDTGIGIPQEEQVRIFERFYRVDRARSRALGGTGLGLSIVKHIIEAHEGNIQANSAPGKGTQFTMTLPQKPAQVEVLH